MQTEISDQKQSLRKQLNTDLSSYSSEKLTQWAYSVQKKVLDSDIFASSQNIGLYQSAFHELETKLLFEESKGIGKKLAYPKIEDEKGPLVFFWVDTQDQLQKSKWGVFEPDEKRGAQKASMDEIDLLIIPGLAFDRSGFRLGRGKGFYDRTLKNFLGQRLGLAYSFQLFSQIPHETWDEKVNWLATEKEWICV